MLFIRTLLGKLLPLEPSTWRLLAGLIACSSLISPNAIAQIIPDNTLGDENSVVVPDVEIKGVNSDRLEGGAVRGSNLFHSFQEFNIDAGRGAYFANPAAIENIFSRVTGGNVSEIFGTLGVLGNANLFLINPNGIIFGQNASLDLRGSFVGTTADSIVFPDGKEFSATNPGLPPLLTVNVEQPIGLKFEGESGIITNAADLAVASLQTLSLSGNEVSTTGNLTAPGGRVELLGIETVALLEDGTIDVSSETGGGTVLIGGDFQGQGTVPNAKRTYVDDNFTINADALTNGNGGTVIVWADEVTGFYGKISARGGVESGDGGLVEVSGKEHLIFRGNVNTSAVNGLVGNLLLDPTNIIIADGSRDEAGDGTDTFAGNNSEVEGSILTAPLSEINDTAPTTIYESELEELSGDTNIILQATNDITLQNLSDDGLELAAGEGVIALSADADGDGVGDFVMEDSVTDTIFTNGRNIAISGAKLTIGNIDTSQQAANSGSINLQANGNISTGNLNSSSSADVTSGNGGSIFLQANGNISTGNLNSSSSADVTSGNGGSIFLQANGNISTGNLNSSSSANVLFSDTSSSGGAINLQANGNISTGNLSSSSLALTLRPSLGFGNIVGNAGDISLQAGDSLNFGDIEAIGLLGGNIKINSDAILSISDQLIISLSTGSGDGGDINITAPKIILSNFGRVFNLTIGDAGKGGDIVINTDSEVGRVEILNETVSDSPRNSNPVVSLIDDNIPGTSFLTATGGSAEGGNLTINTSELIIHNNIDLRKKFRNILFSPLVGAAAITTPAIPQFNLPTSKGKGGNLTVNAYKSVEIMGNDPPEPFTITPNREQALSIIDLVTVLTTSIIGEGDGGNLTVNTEQLTTKFGAAVASTISEREGTIGNGGDITINANQVKLQGRGGLGSATFASGNAGNLTVNADFGLVQVLDGATIAADTITADTFLKSGNAGELTINTGELFVGNGSRIGSATFDEGAGGTVRVNASNLVELVGTSAFGTVPSGLFAETRGKGDGGKIIINSPQLTIDQGASISASTTASGNGGSIFIDSQVVTLNNSQIAVNSEGAGIGGNIDLQTVTLALKEQSAIAAETVSTDGGDIELNLGGNLVLRDHSQISATAGTAQAGGDGGNININTQFILAFPSEDSDITANAFEGNGGNISITAEGILGIEFREQRTILSDITASSELGLAGTVEINTPETDPNRGLVTLPQQAVDTQVALGCDVDGEGAVAFYDLGRGGLSASPDDFLMPNTVIDEWLPLIPSSTSFTEPQKLSFELNSQQKATVVRQLVPLCWQ